MEFGVKVKFDADEVESILVEIAQDRFKEVGLPCGDWKCLPHYGFIPAVTVTFEEIEPQEVEKEDAGLVEQS